MADRGAPCAAVIHAGSGERLLRAAGTVTREIGSAAAIAVDQVLERFEMSIRSWSEQMHVTARKVI